MTRWDGKNPSVGPPDWTYDALRIGIAAVVVVPGASKFLTYGRSVAFFRALGVPEPAVLVIVVGAIEVSAAALLFVDRWTPIAALALLPVVIVAALIAGPTWQNVGVFLGALGLGLGLGLGLVRPRAGKLHWRRHEPDKRGTHR